jgi:hypothetical protein
MPSSEQLPADQFVQRFRANSTPLNAKIHWFSSTPLSQDDRGETVEEPLSSLPPRLVESLPKLTVFLVPYLTSRAKQPDLVVSELPEGVRSSESFQIVGPDDASILVATQQLSSNEIHYALFSAISSLAWEVATPEIRSEWAALLRDELARDVHGEIDENSWAKKNALLARHSAPFRDTKLFREYVRASYIDTLTLFLHGICCDIDVEPGPRQIPSREIRKRLEKLRTFYPLGEGLALFPEELSREQGARKGRRRRMRGDVSKPPFAASGSAIPHGKNLPETEDTSPTNPGENPSNSTDS